MRETQIGGARGGAISSDPALVDPDLALLIDRWAILPDDAKVAIMAIVADAMSAS